MGRPRLVPSTSGAGTARSGWYACWERPRDRACCVSCLPPRRGSMPADDPDARQAPGRPPSPAESRCRLKLRTGRELPVVNISSTGALVEGLTRLLPGTHAEVHLITRHGRVLVRTRIVRSLVWRLGPEVVWYRSALAFDTTVDTDGPQSELSESNGPALTERSEPDDSPCESEGYPLPAEIPSNSEAPGNRYPNAEVEGRV